MGKWLNNIGRIIKNKKGGHFLIFERRKDKNQEYIGESPFPLTVNEGDIFQLRPKREDLQKLVDDGKLSAEAAESICAVVRFEVSRAPLKEEKSEPAKAKSKSSKSKDEVNF